MKFKLLLFIALVPTLTSCNGQPSSPINEKAAANIGEIVRELDKAIFVVFQDSKDNYWFGSDGKGVYRFDGKTIVHYSTKDGLGNERIREIKEDKAGNILFASINGISKFDGKKFTVLPIVDSKEWKLQPDDLWFVSFKPSSGKNGPYRYDGKTLYRLEFPRHYREDSVRINPAFSSYDVYTNYKDSKGNIWFGTTNFGVCRYDGKTLSWLYEQHLTEVENGGWFCIRSIIEDKKGKFWFCNTSYRFDIDPGNLREEKGNKMISYKREKGIEQLNAPDSSKMIYFMAVVEGNDDALWMVTYNQGVYRYDGKNVTHYPIKNDGKDFTAFSIYKDKQGGLWVGTHEGGAYKFNGTVFEKFTVL